MSAIYGKYGVYRSRSRAWFDLVVLCAAWLITFLPPIVDRWMARLTVLVYRTVLSYKVSRLAAKMSRLAGPDPPAGTTWSAVALSYWEMRIESHWMRARALHRRDHPLDVRIEGIEHLESSLAEGRGVVMWRMLFTSSHIPKRAMAEAGYPMVHLSHWDHGSRGLGFAGLRIFAPLWMRAETRCLVERVTIPRDGSLDYLRRLVRHLEAARIVSIFGNMQGTRAPVPIEVLQTKRLLATGAPALAHRTGAALLTMRARREAPYRYVVTIDSPIQADRSLPRRAFIEEAIREYAARVEAAVRANPESWFRWTVYGDHR